MNAPRLAICTLTVLVAGFMAFDGTRALLVGSLITPSSGPYAGQMGPWRFVVSAVGIDPAGLMMRWIFAIYGWTWLGIAVAFALRQSWAWPAMVVAAAGALWFLPFGTSVSLVLLVLLNLYRTALQ